jgi:hypothetical protein
MADHPEDHPEPAASAAPSRPITYSGGSDLEAIVSSVKNVWSGFSQLPKVASDIGKVAVGAGAIWLTSNVITYYTSAVMALKAINLYVMGAAFAFGDFLKKAKSNVEMTYGAVVRQSLKGVSLGALLHPYYEFFIDKIPVHKAIDYVWKALAILPLFPPYVHAERLMEHGLGGEKYTIKGGNEEYKTVPVDKRFDSEEQKILEYLLNYGPARYEDIAGTFGIGIKEARQKIALLRKKEAIVGARKDKKMLLEVSPKIRRMAVKE